jgi:hypothetical protein
MADHPHKRLTSAQREEITRRVLAGEKAVPLSKEFKVTSAYVRLLKKQALNPDPVVLAKSYLKKLAPHELEEFKKTLATTTPEDHGFYSYPYPERWRLEHGYLLGEKLFGRRPSKRVVVECMTPHLPKAKDFRFERPRPPRPHHISQIPPEFAGDPDYVAYYLSPICEQIVRREYEFALADYEARFAEADEKAQAAKDAELEADMMDFPKDQDFRPAAPRQRTGKHAKGKGSPFTPPKRRKSR